MCGRFGGRRLSSSEWSKYLLVAQEGHHGGSSGLEVKSEEERQKTHSEVHLMYADGEWIVAVADNDVEEEAKDTICPMNKR